MLNQVIVIAATIGMLVFNGLATTGVLGGVATNFVSDKYPTRITPAGYAFAIWSLIYLGMIAFSIYQALPRNAGRLKPVRTLYLVTCVLNCAWLYAWHHEWLIACLVLIGALAASLIAINSTLIRTESTADYWLVKAPFGIYAGWVTAATLVNLTIVLVANDIAVGQQIWFGSLLVFVAAALGVAVRITLSSHLYPLAIAWAATAIAVKQSGTTLIVVSCAVSVIVCLVAAVSVVLELPTRKTE